MSSVKKTYTETYIAAIRSMNLGTRNPGLGRNLRFLRVGAFCTIPHNRAFLWLSFVRPYLRFCSQVPSVRQQPSHDESRVDGVTTSDGGYL